MSGDIPKSTLEALSGLPKDLQACLFQLRQLIIDAASENSAIGRLEETLKWGEPAFLTSATKSGTTIRINRHVRDDSKYAMYVHCQTDLVERYKQLYGDVLRFDGTRAVVFDVGCEASCGGRQTLYRDGTNLSPERLAGFNLLQIFLVELCYDRPDCNKQRCQQRPDHNSVKSKHL